MLNQKQVEILFRQLEAASTSYRDSVKYWLAFRKNAKSPKLGKKLDYYRNDVDKEADMLVILVRQQDEYNAFTHYEIAIKPDKCKMYNLNSEYIGTTYEKLVRDIKAIFYDVPDIIDTAQNKARFLDDMTTEAQRAIESASYRKQKFGLELLQKLIKLNNENMAKSIGVRRVEYENILEDYLEENNMRGLRTRQNLVDFKFFLAEKILAANPNRKYNCLYTLPTTLRVGMKSNNSYYIFYETRDLDGNIIEEVEDTSQYAKELLAQLK